MAIGWYLVVSAIIFSIGAAGVLTPTVIVIALLISVVAFPCTFLAKLIIARMPVHVHTAVLDAVVLIGGAVMISGAFKR